MCTLSSSDHAGILCPAVPAGIPFPAGPVGPVGTLSLSDPVGTLSPSDSDSVGPVGPDARLSSSDLAGILFPAVPTIILFLAGSVGPVGTPSPSDSVGPDGTLSPTDIAGILFQVDFAELITVGVADVDVVGRRPCLLLVCLLILSWLL